MVLKSNKIHGLKFNQWFELPKWCLECHQYISRALGSPSKFLCHSCYDALPFTDNSLCEQCALDHQLVHCHTPWGKQIHRFHTIFTYDDPLDRWVGKFKYYHNVMEGRLLRSFVTDWFKKNEDLIHEIDLILPVPIHWRGLWRRGFNQTDYLISDCNLSKVNHRILTKNRHTKHQAELSRKERVRNLKGAFEINKNIEGKRVLLFDDICTTGGTIEELCRLLHKNKVLSIDLLVLCRTL